MNRFNTALFNLGQVLPHLWDTVDFEMDLKDCKIYVYEADSIEDPYSSEGLLWRLMYFFHNKHKKRVCYLYLRAISKSSHSHYSRTMENWEEEAEDVETDSESLWGEYGFDDSDEFLDDMEI